MKHLARTLRAFRWRVRNRLTRLAVGWRYTWGTMTEHDANSMAYDCTILTGRYSLEELSRDSVLEQCRDRFGDIADLPELVANACERVWSKWDSSGDLTSAAEDWAMDKVLEYAAARGITLVDHWSLDFEEETEIA